MINLPRFFGKLSHGGQGVAVARWLLLAGAAVLGSDSGHAETIASSNFSIALGATYISGAAVCWTTVENTASNSPTTMGDFSVVPSVPTGRAFTQNGPVFANRALATGGTTNVTGSAADFELRISGSYDGLVPRGARDLGVTLEITRLSVWGWSSTTHTAVTNMFFVETTPAHGAVSPTVNLRSGPFSAAAVCNAGNYTQLAWDPADFSAPLTAVTRTFNVNGGGALLCIEGLTIEGRVVVSYTPPSQAPPAVEAQLGLGLLLADPFATYYTGDQQNSEMTRQSGVMAPATYLDLPLTANSWQSQLSGTGLVLYPSPSYPMPGLRTEANFTNSNWLSFAIDLDAIADGYSAGFAVGCDSHSQSIYDPDAFAIRVSPQGTVLAISQGQVFLSASVTASDLYRLEVEVSNPPEYDGSGTAILRVSINGEVIDLNGPAPGVSIGRPGFSANHLLLQTSGTASEFIPAARFKNLVVIDLRPRAETTTVLFHDSFNSAYSGPDLNRGEVRQTGPCAPVNYSKASNDPAGSWRSELNGKGLSLNANGGFFAAVRTDANFTNAPRLSISVRIAPADYRPHNRFGIGCGPSDMDPNVSPTGVGIMIWRDSGHVFVYDRGSTVFDGFVPVSPNYRAQFDVDTPAAYDGSGTAAIDVAINGIALDLNGVGAGTTYQRPGLTCNHILMTSYIAAAGTNTVFDDLLVSRWGKPFAPRLTLTSTATNALMLKWPVIANWWDLEQSDSLGASTWSFLQAAPSEQGTDRCINLSVGSSPRFFRLHLNETNLNAAADAVAVTAIVPESHVLVATNGGLWPTLVKLPSGELLAFGHNKPGHTTLPGDEDCWASSDGVSWQKRATAAARASTNANWADACAGLAANGDVLLMTGGYTDPGGTRRAPAAPALFRSGDSGYHWRQRGFVPASLPLGECARPYGQIVGGTDGTLRTIAYDQFGTGSAYMLISRDDGMSWSEAVCVGWGINESVLCEVGPRHWLAVGRTVSKPSPVNGQELWQYRSRDNGMTWSDERLVAGYSKHPPKLLRLADGRLLLSYCNRRNGAIEVRFSADQGMMWGAPRSVAVAGGDRGYPDSAQLPSGKIVTVYYAQSTSLYSGYQMAAVVWSPPLAGN